jgi:hypothetical protein
MREKLEEVQGMRKKKRKGATLSLCPSESRVILDVSRFSRGQVTDQKFRDPTVRVKTKILSESH